MTAARQDRAAKLLGQYLKAGVLARTIIRDDEVIVEPVSMDDKKPDAFEDVDFRR